MGTAQATQGHALLTQPMGQSFPSAEIPTPNPEA